MPIHEYRCASCGNEFEHLHALTSTTDPGCPSCGGGDVRRLISLVAGLGSRATGLSRGAASGGGCACGGACACRN